MEVVSFGVSPPDGARPLSCFLLCFVLLPLLLQNMIDFRIHAAVILASSFGKPVSDVTGCSELCLHIIHIISLKLPLK